ncbi:HNH endonuclease [Chloroflexia bacterium SDU3-3]|nr:HNH endonuclease [Chloroflexia bacterium SDU3-3]
MIDSYTRAFAKLRSDAVPSRWGAATMGRAPHKPLLLLSILDLIAQGQIQTNVIVPNADLLDVFDLYWVKVMGREREGNLAMPFFHLRSEGFWHLIALPGQDALLSSARQIRSLRDLRAAVLGASLDRNLFQLLTQPHSRDDLRRVLIERYFAPETRPLLVEAGQIAQDSFTYSRELLDRTRGVFRIEEAPDADEGFRSESRSAAFRRVMVQAYAHTCAACGIRLLTPEGRTAVAAAHIVPWSHSHNDDPRNGLALCGLHHWAFDQGMITVTPAHQLAVSPAVADDAGAAPIRDLGGRAIHLPADARLRPATEALRWHGRNIFRADESWRAG